MDGKLTFEVATPERLVVSEQVDEVTMPSVLGYMGVLPGHAPLLALLPGAVVKISSPLETASFT